MVEMFLLKDGALNIRYNYANMTDLDVSKKPFEVPADIIGVDRYDLNPTGKLSDYVSITQADASSPLKIDVMNGKSTKVFSLNGF